MMENKFNLIDEPWIPVASFGLVSLKEVFSNPAIPSLGGNAVEKIAVTKLLHAIAQRASTPADEIEWKALGAEGVAEKCLAYLEEWHHAFWLYGEKPFLQMPSLASYPESECNNYSALRVTAATNSKDAFSERSFPVKLTDSERALLLVEQMAMSVGGKKTSNLINLSQPGVPKAKSAKPGPGVGGKGYLHNFVQGTTLLTSSHMNLFTQENIDSQKIWSNGFGIPPWELMPTTETCDVAVSLMNSLVGRLVPLSRFMLLLEDKVYTTEGILHKTHMDGMIDPSVIADQSKAKLNPVTTETSKKPWRQLPGLLSYSNTHSGQRMGNCTQIDFTFGRSRDLYEDVGIWSGGLGLTVTMGEQFAVGTCDYVDSLIMFESSDIGATFVSALETEMVRLNGISGLLSKHIISYGSMLQIKKNPYAEKAVTEFWSICESYFNELMKACYDNEVRDFRKKIAAIVNDLYDRSCQKQTSRQLSAWAKCRPKLDKYLKEKKK
jgi:CRISPR system Cascade subunit CasA